MDPNYVPRSVKDVLQQILLVIPDTEDKLLTELINFTIYELKYKAPELLISSDTWICFLQILNRFIPEQKEEWHLEIKRILENKTEN